jgi:ABC-2 type transport system ATP-binding protein
MADGAPAHTDRASTTSGNGAGRTADPVLVCTGLRKTYGERVAVDGVGFTIDRGETYGLLGPNGAGKTTTISMVCGLLDRDAGDVTVAGRPMTPEATDAKAAIGLVPQEVALYDDLSAEENLRFFGRLQGLDGAVLRERVAAALDLVGLADRARDHVGDYSGGMKRRANIAAGLLHHPQLLVLDEPTVGVDPQSRNAILESIEALGGEGLSVLYTTHYMEEAQRLCDRVGIIDEGRLVAEGTHRELVAQLGASDRLDVSGTGDLAAFAHACAALPGTLGVDRRDGGVVVRVADGAAALAGIVTAAERTGTSITGIELTEPDLEDVFLALTGKALRD